MGMLHAQVFTFNPFYENTYVLHDGTAAILVDPGCYEPHERQELLDYLLAEQLRVVAIICTHAHIDHVLGVHWAQTHFKVPFYLPSGEEVVLSAVVSYAAQYGFPSYTAPLGHELLPTTDVTLLASPLAVLSLPGHSPGHIGLYSAADGWAVVGDTLFQGSIGRVDLPGGDLQMLLSSIRQELFTLDGQTRIYPGHGAATTVAQEVAHNPFLNGGA